MSLATRAMLVAVVALAGCGGGNEGASIALYDLERQVHGPVERGDVTCGRTAEICPGADATAAEYSITGDPHLDTDDFDTERAQALVADVTGQPAVILDVRPEGAASFETFTRTLAWVGREEGEPQHLAIVIDDELVAWPAIDYREYPDGLSAAGGIQIAVPTVDAAQRLARKIRGEN